MSTEHDRNASPPVGTPAASGSNNPSDDPLLALLGKSVQLSKTVSESDLYLFAGITGDFAPHHIDEEYCRRTSIGSRVVHGCLTLSYSSAASTRVIEGINEPIVSLGYDRVRFVRVAHIGDTLTVKYDVIKYDETIRRATSRIEITNQRGETVAVATHLLQAYQART